MHESAPWEPEDIREWTERNRLAREEYFTSPGPHTGRFKVVAPQEADRGNPPRTIRQALGQALEDLQRAQVTISRQGAMILDLYRQVIELETKLGERQPTCYEPRTAPSAEPRSA